MVVLLRARNCSSRLCDTQSNDALGCSRAICRRWLPFNDGLNGTLVFGVRLRIHVTGRANCCWGHHLGPSFGSRVADVGEAVLGGAVVLGFQRSGSWAESSRWRAVGVVIGRRRSRGKFRCMLLEHCRNTTDFIGVSPANHILKRSLLHLSSLAWRVPRVGRTGPMVVTTAGWAST